MSVTKNGMTYPSMMNSLQFTNILPSYIGIYQIPKPGSKIDCITTTNMGVLIEDAIDNSLEVMQNPSSGDVGKVIRGMLSETRYVNLTQSFVQVFLAISDIELVGSIDKNGDHLIDLTIKCDLVWMALDH
jgi:hypothetical protein